MANLYTKIKLYLEANSKTWDDAVGLVDFNSDETGLTSWTVNGLAEPTAEQIASYETAANAEENLATVVSVRQYNYKSIVEQLDLLYHDMTAGKLDNTGEWHKAVKKVKDDNPKG